jgi:hypothetical protein
VLGSKKAYIRPLDGYKNLYSRKALIKSVVWGSNFNLSYKSDYIRNKLSHITEQKTFFIQSIKTPKYNPAFKMKSYWGWKCGSSGRESA